MVEVVLAAILIILLLLLLLLIYHHSLIIARFDFASPASFSSSSSQRVEVFATAAQKRWSETAQPLGSLGRSAKCRRAHRQMNPLTHPPKEGPTGSELEI